MKNKLVNFKKEELVYEENRQLEEENDDMNDRLYEALYADWNLK